MGEQLKKLLETIKDFWSRQTRRAKAIIISVASGILVFAVVVALIFNTDSYAELYTGLDSAEAAQIMTAIQEMGASAKLEGNGTILVPKDDKLSLQMQLGTMGYPKSGLTYEIWDEGVNMFSTDFDKRERSKQQLQQRLIDTYKTLDGIKDAIVTIDIPQIKDYVINEGQESASASIVLHLKPGHKLTSSEILGVQHIAAMAVSSLEPENIAITDGTGKLLLAEEGDDDSSEEKKLLFKNQYEETVKSGILQLLTPVFGDEKVKVVVNAALNYDKKITEDTQYTPSVGEDGMVESEEKTGAIGGNNPEGGLVGVDPNADDIPDYSTIGEIGSDEYYYEFSKSTRYLVNTNKTQIEKQGFSVDKLNVSVMIDRNEMEDAEIDRIASSVAMAAGTNPEDVAITNMAFYPDGVAPDPGLMPSGDDALMRLMFYIAAVFAAVILSILLFLTFTRKSRKKKRLRAKQEMLVAEAAGENGEVEGFFNVPEEVKYNIPSLTEEAKKDSKETVLKREIGEFARTSPEIAAQLIRGWLKEDDI